MIKQKTRTRKYYAPQNDSADKMCDHPGCQKKGEFRAPKDRKLKEYYWFCLDHVQEYNARWNYYDGPDDSDEQEKVRSKMHFKYGSKIKYNFGFDFKGNFEYFDEYGTGFAEVKEALFTAEDKKCLIVMELNIEDEITVDVVKKQYKKLVKKYHPDLHQGDKTAEEKFKILGQAYKTLLAKLS